MWSLPGGPTNKGKPAVRLPFWIFAPLFSLFLFAIEAEGGGGILLGLLLNQRIFVKLAVKLRFYTHLASNFSNQSQLFYITILQNSSLENRIALGRLSLNVAIVASAPRLCVRIGKPTTERE